MELGHGRPQIQSVVSASLPHSQHISMRDALSSRKSPPKNKGMEQDRLLEWWDQGCGDFTPITSQHGDLSPVHSDLDGDGKLLPAPQASKEVAALAFNKPAEKVIYWSIQRFQTKLLPRRNERCIPTLPHHSVSK